ncbi:MAG: hypothetical protein NVV83_22015 [Afipia sp.]|nr:hypothetical protein [Afipia sp.]
MFRDLVLIEMKHLETDQKDRLNDTYQKNVDPEEHPVFFGSRPIDLDKLSNGKQIGEVLASKLSQTIETQLRKANRQFGDYLSRNPRKNSVSICVFLNSRLDEFSPQVVLHSIHRKMKGPGGEPRFPSIDAVIYITEKHYQMLPDGRMAFAIVIYGGASIVEQYWKSEFIDRVVQKWSHFRTGGDPVDRSHDGSGFEVVEDVPERMTRSDSWRLAYKRNPYLRGMTDQELKVHFNRCVALNSLSFVIGDWTKPTHEETAAGMKRFTDALEEINKRSLDMRDVSPKFLSAEERSEVHRGLPEELVAMLSGNRPAQ